MKWIAEFDLEDGDTMPEHMDLTYKGAKLDFHCRPLTECKAEDCISRSQAIKEFCKQTCETPNCRFRDKGIIHASCDEVDVLKRLPSVYPKSECNAEDCISRKAIFEMLVDIDNAIYDGDGFQYQEWHTKVDELPSVTPKNDNSVLKDIKDDVMWDIDQERDSVLHSNITYIPNDVLDIIDRISNSVDNHMSGKE